MVHTGSGNNSPTPAGWPGAVNAWRVRPGLWRMGRAEWLTEAGWEAMATDGVRAVVDLRLPQEVKRRLTDPAEVPIPEGLRRLAAPIEEADHPQFQTLVTSLETPYVNHPELYDEALRIFPDRVAAALNTVLKAWRDGGVVVHCSAGRDRTGMLVALLLQLPEVPDGPASWEEQAAIYTSGVRGINDYRRTTTVPHPYERYVQPDEFDEHLDERLEALRAFLEEWPGEKVRELMKTGTAAGSRRDGRAQACQRARPRSSS